MTAIADLIGKDGGDLTYSWLTLASLTRDKAARLQVAAELARRAARGGRRRITMERRRMAVYAREWLEPMIPDIARAFGDDRASLFGKFAETGLPHVRQVRERQRKPPTPAPACPVGPTLVVASGDIPLMKGDRDDKALVEAWRFLAAPLPLAVGPMPGLLETALQLEFPWMAEAIAAIVDDLRLRLTMGLPWFKVRPLLLAWSAFRLR